MFVRVSEMGLWGKLGRFDRESDWITAVVKLSSETRSAQEGVTQSDYRLFEEGRGAVRYFNRDEEFSGVQERSAFQVAGRPQTP